MSRRKPQPRPPHRCPQHCHPCPDLGGDVMPHCWGMAHQQGSPNHNDLSYCICTTEKGCDREAARRVAESRFLPGPLRAALLRFAEPGSNLEEALLALGEWIYCADRQPPKRGRYETACCAPGVLKGDPPRLYRTFSRWMRRPGCGWEEHGDGYPYAWREIMKVEPPLRDEDIAWLIERQAFQPEWFPDFQDVRGEGA